MTILLWCLGIFVANFLVGCAVCAAIDDEDQRLFKWAITAPYPGLYQLVVSLWPVVWYFWRRRQR